MTDNPDRDKALKQAYSKATSDLRKQHQEEFNERYRLEAAARGFEITLRPSPEEKAREQVRQLLAANPAIKDELVTEIRNSLETDDLPALG